MAFIAIGVFIAVFAIATLRKVHLGVLMFPAACGVGVFMAGMPLREVVGGFPINIMVLLAGVTFFFGIAQRNGTVGRVIERLLTKVGSRRHMLPFVFFAMTAGVAAMGSPQAGLVFAPIAMAIVLLVFLIFFFWFFQKIYRAVQRLFIAARAFLRGESFAQVAEKAG